MRRIIVCLFLIIIVILSCGCVQPTPQPAPQPTFMPEVTPVPVATTDIPVQKQINVTVTKTTNEIIINYNGGADSADLLALKVLINNQDGTKIERTFINPVPGSQYVITYRGLCTAVVVNIVGVFTGGVEQTVLMDYP